MNAWHFTHLPKSVRKGKTPEEIDALRKEEYEKTHPIPEVIAQ